MTDSPAADGLVLSIDLGTSGPKAALVAPDGTPRGSARATVNILRGPEGAAEQNPDEIWSAVLDASRRALDGAQGEVRAVIVSSQYSSIVPVNRAGEAIGNMILWQDQRGATVRLKKLDGVPKRIDHPLAQLRWLRIHGLPPIAGGLSLTHMRYLKFAQPEVYAAADKLLEPMDYINLRLTGRAATNQCCALMSLAVDNRTLTATEYHPRLVAQSHIDLDKFPELLPVDGVVGELRAEVADAIGVPRGIPVITGLNDTQAGAIGAAAFTGDHAALSIGTTGVLISHVPFKRTDVRTAILSMPSPVPNTYFIMAENGLAGGALEMVARWLFADERSDEGSSNLDCFIKLDQAAAAAAPGAGGTLFLPWLTGSMAPSAHDHMRGGFVNLSAATSKSDLARAAMEGVALNLRWVRAASERFAKRRFSHLKVYGGGSRSDTLCQILADVMGIPVQRLAHSEFTVAIGAALLAFERLGVITTEEIAALVSTERTFTPNPNLEELYRRQFEGFTKSFSSLLPIIRNLNRK